jgi:hypothetical protein
MIKSNTNSENSAKTQQKQKCRASNKNTSKKPNLPFFLSPTKNYKSGGLP